LWEQLVIEIPKIKIKHRTRAFFMFIPYRLGEWENVAYRFAWIKTICVAGQNSFSYFNHLFYAKRPKPDSDLATNASIRRENGSITDHFFRVY